MGSSTSNISNEIVKAIISVTTSASQTCKIEGNQVQSCTFSNNTGENANYDLYMTQNMVIDAQCLQDSKTQTQTNQNVSQAASQIAKSIAQQFSLSSSDASNFAKAVVELSTTVSNSYISNCNGAFTQVQSCTFNNNNVNNVNIYANLQQFNNTSFDCVLKDSSVTTAAQKVQQSIDQQASATTENFLAGILGSVVAVLAGVGLLMFIVIYALSPGRPTSSPTIKVDTKDLTKPVAVVTPKAAVVTTPPVIAPVAVVA